ncbi:hypothetical protein M153_1510001235 [Pseudoloma neurophilia]|uniref:Uncharacterized protein n=1 Tax=Pseudoloma neurophilia TaxID=146866 RepID=A0A0R0LZT5_9MICR|nr:hypothetical protein M153_1510001235 [Pseudoloma neurophilia]
MTKEKLEEDISISSFIDSIEFVQTVSERAEFIIPFQFKNLEEARFQYDKLTIFAPLILLLTRATFCEDENFDIVVDMNYSLIRARISVLSDSLIELFLKEVSEERSKASVLVETVLS